MMYDPYVKDDKFFFAIFLNLARQNSRQILNTIYSKVYNKSSINFGEEKLFMHPIFINFNNSNNEIDLKINTVIKLLSKRMPFLTFKLEDKPSEIFKRAQLFFDRLDHLRNYFSHYYNTNKVWDKSIGNVGPNNTLDELKRETSKGILRRNIDKMNQNEKDFINQLSIQCTDKLKQEDLLFYICLFLTRNQIDELINQIKVFDEINNKIYLLEYFTRFSLRTTHEKIKHEDPKQALFLELINYLGKCPKIVIEQYYKRPELNGEILNRGKDKFLYYTLQYFEHCKKYPLLKPQINIGRKFLFPPFESLKAEEKVVVEYHKKILGFGDLTTADEFYNGYISTSDETTDTIFKYPAKFISPKYFNNLGRLAFRYNISGFPIIEDNVRPSNGIPEFYLSENDLPYLVYFALKDRDTEAFRYILNFIKERDIFFNDILKDRVSVLDNETLMRYNQRISNVPSIIRNFYAKKIYKNDSEQIQEFFIGNIIFNQKLKVNVPNKLGEISVTTELITKYSKAYQAVPGEKLMKIGEIATWLAHDIVKFMKPTQVKINGIEHSQKLSKVQFNVLQFHLAYFGKYSIDYINKYFESLNLIGKDKKHPFLENVKLKTKLPGVKTGLEGFFRSYLYKKLDWLNTEYNTLKSPPEYYYIHIKKDKNEQNVKNYIKQILVEPVYLPKGLLKPLLGDGLNLIQTVIKDKSEKQWFYEPVLFDTEKLENSDNRQKIVANNESAKAFRYELMKDNLLLEVAKGFLDIAFLDKFGNFDLTNFTKPSDENSKSILDRKVDHVFILRSGKIRADLRMGDWDRVRHLLFEKRLNGLFKYFSESNIITLKRVTEEFEKYRSLQFEILPKCFTMEKNKFIGGRRLFESKIPEGTEYLKFDNLLNVYYPTKKELHHICKEIRDKLSHNEIPFLIIPDIKEEILIVEQINKFGIEVINSLDS